MFFRLCSQLLELEPRSRLTEFTASKFTQLIRRQFSADDYIIKTDRSYAVDFNSVIVSGLYDGSLDDQHLPHTEITLYYHPHQLPFRIHEMNWRRVVFDIAECVGHEHIHRIQHRNKTVLNEYISTATDPKLYQDQTYLGHDEELDAYGFSIAAESIVFSVPYVECEMYKIYEQTFDTDINVIVKLQKNIVKYIEQLETEPDYE
jgi:hypothetical protein